MAIQVQCGACFETLRVRDELAGKTTRCKSCGEPIRVGKVGSDSPKPKKSKAVQQAAEEDDEELASELAPAPKKKGAKRTNRSSSQPIWSMVYDTPWAFFVIAIGLGFGVYSFLPEKFESGEHLVVVREAPIAIGYLIVGMIWHVAIGGYSDRWRMTISENYAANLKMRLQIGPIMLLIVGAVQLENIALRLLCGAAILAIVVWKSRELKPAEWRPLALILIGIGFLLPTLFSLYQTFRR